ncbi:MAG: hypothetical protein JNM43_01945 [Planctomycetaceae bacterium]|nr:hypothetical protein [Planctomycetaceae bacterium]
MNPDEQDVDGQSANELPGSSILSENPEPPGDRQGENQPSITGSAADSASDNPIADFSRFAARFLFTHNPFYVISAALFVWGLKLLFRVGDNSILFAQGSVGYMEPWGLMASLCGVTFLMAATAIVIVQLEARAARHLKGGSGASSGLSSENVEEEMTSRPSFGSVWEDIRSLILIVLLMFPAISVSFDELLTQASQSGRSGMVILMFAAGLGFLLMLMELLIAGLRVRLAAAWRLPIYSVLTLFFIWPLLLLPEWNGQSREQIRWLIFAFPTVASVAFLGLLPAIRRGKSSVAKNGTPWGWPWFPWTGIVFLVGTVVFRAYSLTMAFDPTNLIASYWDTSFGIYFLVPLGFCLLTLLLEIALTERNDDLRRLSYGLAPFLLIAACPWTVPWNHLPTYRLFVSEFVSVAGSPVFVALCVLFVFYGVGFLRRVQGSETGVLLCLMLATVITPKTYADPFWSFRDTDFQAWPLLPLALIQGVRGWTLRSSLRLMMSFGCSTLLILKVMNGDLPSGVKWFLVIHLMLVALLIAAYRLSDDFAQFLRSLAPLCFTATILLGSLTLAKGTQVTAAWLVYALMLTLGEFSIGKLLHDNRFQKHSFVLLCAGLAIGSLVLPVSLSRAQLAGGIRPVVFAGVSFVVAVCISILKTGYRSVLILRWRRLRDWALS